MNKSPRNNPLHRCPCACCDDGFHADATSRRGFLTAGASFAAVEAKIESAGEAKIETVGEPKTESAGEAIEAARLAPPIMAIDELGEPPTDVRH